jgi:hypothetical protein
VQVVTTQSCVWIGASPSMSEGDATTVGSMPSSRRAVSIKRSKLIVRMTRRRPAATRRAMARWPSDGCFGPASPSSSVGLEEPRRSAWRSACVWVRKLKSSSYVDDFANLSAYRANGSAGSTPYVFASRPLSAFAAGRTYGAYACPPVVCRSILGRRSVRRPRGCPHAREAGVHPPGPAGRR